MKQSSIEWLMEQITYDNGFGKRSNSYSDSVDLSAYFEKAKAMHKDEIENAYWDGGQWVPTVGSQCEEYYNETFNTKDKLKQ